MPHRVTKGKIMRNTEDKKTLDELSCTVGYVTDQKDMLGRPITIGDEVMVKHNVGRSADFIPGTIQQQIIGTSGLQPRFYVQYKNGSIGRKDTHRILVITDQVKKNKEEYPELYI